MLSVIIFVYIVICVFIGLFIKDKISKCLICIYVTYWCVSLFICRINPYEFYQVSDKSYFLLLFHVVSFLIGFSLIKVRGGNFGKVDLSLERIVTKPLFLCLFFVCFLFVCYIFMRQRALLAFYSLSDVRGDFMDLALGKSGPLYLMYSVVASAMYHFSLCCVVYLLFFDRKWKLIVLLFSYVLLFSILGGGRAQIMNIAYYLLGIWILSDRIISLRCGRILKYKIPTMLKILIPIIIVFAVVAMSFMSAMRSGGYTQFSMKALSEGLNILGQTFVEYSIGPIVAFDTAIDNDTYLKQCEGYWYGRATFGGFDYLFYLLGRKLGVYFASAYDSTTLFLQYEYIFIGPDRLWNYAYTSCIYYYFDFGYMGILILSCVLGIIVRTIIRRFYNVVDIYSIAMIIFIAFCLYMSVFSGYLHKLVTIPYILSLLFLSNRSRQKN